MTPKPPPVPPRLCPAIGTARRVAGTITARRPHGLATTTSKTGAINMTEALERFMARQWGRKAKASGLTIRQNPYRAYETRLAWLRGFNETQQESAA